MNFLNNLIDGLVGFVRRNPLTVLLIVVLALTAPTLLRGLATLILYLIFGFVLFIVIVLMMMRWRLYKVQQQMRQQFGEQQQQQSQGFTGYTHFSGFGRTDGRRSQPNRHPNEGEVKVRKTGQMPEKRISEDVGDYVEFEETKNK